MKSQITLSPHYVSFKYLKAGYKFENILARFLTLNNIEVIVTE